MKLSVEDGFRLHQALAHNGYRVTVHKRFFPHPVQKEDGTTFTAHYAIDHAAQAVYCSQEFYDTLRMATR